MRKIVLLIFTFGFSIGLIAQKNNNFSSIDKIILQIPDSLTISTQGLASYISSNYSNQNDKSRAIFIWIAKNIQYDIENMFALNFYQNTNEIIDKALRTRKGICMNYAELFNDIANKVGIKSYVVSGYTKQNGFVDYIPHAWCVANIDSVWYIFDPTWGSGYIEDSKFIKKVNNYFFKTKPEQIVKSHMPFDPLWQLLNYPITNQEFYEGKTQINVKKQYFNFIDTLSIYEKQSEIERLISSSIRIEKNGVKNSLVFDRLQHNKREIEYYNNKRIIDQYNSATNSYNIGINLLNIFINYRNNQFTPKKPDSEIKLMVDTVDTSFKLSREQLNNIKNPDSNTSSMITQLNKSIDNATVNLNEQKTFLEKYFKTGKLFRKSLFYKYTWM
jgi:Transglutaminase-like superfamily